MDCNLPPFCGLLLSLKDLPRTSLLDGGEQDEDAPGTVGTCGSGPGGNRAVGTTEAFAADAGLRRGSIHAAGSAHAPGQPRPCCPHHLPCRREGAQRTQASKLHAPALSKVGCKCPHVTQMILFLKLCIIMLLKKRIWPFSMQEAAYVTLL